MTSPSREISRKSSVARSYPSELGTVLEEQADDETDQSSAINRSINEQQAQNDTSSSFDGSEAMASLQSSPSQREIMKTKIKYHYMNPIQKFRARRRKPWKLVVQIVKVFLVTIQVRFSGWNYCTGQTFYVFIHKYKWLASLLGNEWRTGLDIASFYNTASVKWIITVKKYVQKLSPVTRFQPKNKMKIQRRIVGTRCCIIWQRYFKSLFYWYNLYCEREVK